MSYGSSVLTRATRCINYCTCARVFNTFRRRLNPPDKRISCFRRHNSHSLRANKSLGIFSNMQGNPLSCNCHLAWFAGWLRKRDMSGVVGHCHDPPRLKDAVVKDIPHHEFKCNSKILFSVSFFLFFCIFLILHSWSLTLWLMLAPRGTFKICFEAPMSA